MDKIFSPNPVGQFQSCTAKDNISVIQNGNAVLSELKNGDSTNEKCRIRLRTNSGGESKFTFQLVNYKSGFSFEYDYNSSNTSECGLAGYWFGLNPSVTPDDAGYVKTSTVSKTVDCLVNP